MNAHTPVKKDRKTFKANRKVLEGMGMITFDHNMRNHKIRSDIDGLTSDWKKVQADFLKAWKDASVG